MQFNVELLLLPLAPVFLPFIGREAWHLASTPPGE
ncbi:C-5 sterol desaturase, partial [Burkholderia pseudomallei]